MPIANSVLETDEDGVLDYRLIGNLWIHQKILERGISSNTARVTSVSVSLCLCQGCYVFIGKFWSRQELDLCQSGSKKIRESERRVLVGLSNSRGRFVYSRQRKVSRAGLENNFLLFHFSTPPGSKKGITALKREAYVDFFFL